MLLTRKSDGVLLNRGAAQYTMPNFPVSLRKPVEEHGTPAGPDKAKCGFPIPNAFSMLRYLSLGRLGVNTEFSCLMF